jgi:hypothetical protein
MPLYNDAVQKYFDLPPAAIGSTIYGEAGSMAQGAWICISSDIRDDILRNTGFRVFACPHIIAGCNWLAGQLEGKACESLLEVSPEALRAKFDIPVEKAGKLLILQDALQSCYANYAAYRAQESAS